MERFTLPSQTLVPSDEATGDLELFTDTAHTILDIRCEKKTKKKTHVKKLEIKQLPRFTL